MVSNISFHKYAAVLELTQQVAAPSTVNTKKVIAAVLILVYLMKCHLSKSVSPVSVHLHLNNFYSFIC